MILGLGSWILGVPLTNRMRDIYLKLQFCCFLRGFIEPMKIISPSFYCCLKTSCISPLPTDSLLASRELLTVITTTILASMSNVLILLIQVWIPHFIFHSSHFYLILFCIVIFWFSLCLTLF
uniref:Uncharacterized protein n=1 Tax=Nelumbo nucifera TaxID=4432 RepID=A0A822XHN1_NELNU|nr:TPA_asm: hypothetical protein HUJ06_020646 [Nelumbo nucifera]